jgi:hypothetical protein
MAAVTLVTSGAEVVEKLTVDNLRRAGSTVHAILRVANKSNHAYRSVQISCAFLSHGRAIDTSDELVPNIEAAEPVYTKVIGPIDPTPPHR